MGALGEATCARVYMLGLLASVFIALTPAQTSAGSVFRPTFVPISASVEKPIAIDGDLNSTGEGETDWVRDEDVNDQPASVVFGVSQGLVTYTDGLDTRRMYRTSSPNGHGHWRGTRLVDAPANYELDACIGAPNRRLSDAWIIGPAALDPALDLQQAYLAVCGGSIYLGVEESQPDDQFEIEINRLPPDRPYAPRRSDGDVLLVFAPDADQPSIRFWHDGDFLLGKAKCGVRCARNAFDVPTAPWGAADAGGQWDGLQIGAKMFVEASVDLTAIAPALADAAERSKGVYVQFRSTSTSAPDNVRDVTPIYGVAVPGLAAVPYLRRLPRGVALDASGSFVDGGMHGEKAEWLIMPSGAELNGERIEILTEDGGSWQTLNKNGVHIKVESARTVVPTIAFRFPGDHVDLLATLTVQDKKGAQTIGPIDFRIWSAITSDSAIFQFAWYDSEQGVTYYSAPKWSGGIAPYLTNWRVSVSDPIWGSFSDGFTGNSGSYAPPFALNPGAEMVIEVPVPSGGFDASMSPYVSGFISGPSVMLPRGKKDPLPTGLKAIVIRI